MRVQAHVLWVSYVDRPLTLSILRARIFSGPRPWDPRNNNQARPPSQSLGLNRPSLSVDFNLSWPVEHKLREDTLTNCI